MAFDVKIFSIVLLGISFNILEAMGVEATQAKDQKIKNYTMSGIVLTTMGAFGCIGSQLLEDNTYQKILFASCCAGAWAGICCLGKAYDLTEPTPPDAARKYWSTWVPPKK